MANFGLIGILVTGIAELIHLIGFASPYWTKYGYYHYGIWTACYSSRCATYPSVPSWLGAVRAFAVLAFLALLGGVVLSILKVFVFKDKKMIPMIAMVSCIAAGVMIFLAVALYGGEYPLKKYHFAYVFEIFAMLLSGGAGAVHFMSMRQIV